MTPLAVRLPLLFAGLALAPAPAMASFVTVDFSSQHNHRIQSNTGAPSNYPEGQVTLGGVPFDIPVGGNNAWHSNTAANSGSGVQVLDVAVGVFGAERVHTLINNYWGRAGSNLALLEFFGSGGAYFAKPLIGNNDIRDYLASSFTNSINGVTTVEVFVSNAGRQARLDMQTIELPDVFLTQTLDTVRLTDSGNVNLQRVWLAGLTVGVPEPTALLLAGGVLSLAASRRCWR